MTAAFAGLAALLAWGAPQAPAASPPPIPPAWTLGSPRFEGFGGIQWAFDDRHVLVGTQWFEVATGLPKPAVPAGVGAPNARWTLSACGGFLLENSPAPEDPKNKNAPPGHLVWNLRTNAKHAWIPVRYPHQAEDVALSRDGRYAAFAWGAEGSEGKDDDEKKPPAPNAPPRHGVTVVEAATGKLAFTAQAAAKKTPSVMVFARAADVLLTASSGDSQRASALDAFEIPGGKRIFTHIEESWSKNHSIDISADGKFAALAGGEYTPFAPLLIALGSGQPPKPLPHSGARVVDVAFQPDGQRLVGLVPGAASGLVSWKLPAGEAEEREPAARGFHTAAGVNFSRDGQRLGTTTAGGIRLWDAATLRETTPDRGGHVEPLDQAAVDPAGRRAATHGQDGSLRIWSLPDGAPRHELRGFPGDCTSLEFSGDGARLLVRIGMNNRHSTSSQRDICMLLVDPAAGKVVRELHLDDVDGEEYSTYAFSPDGKLVAIGLDIGKHTAVVHALADGKLVRMLPRRPLAKEDAKEDANGSLLRARQQAAFSADGAQLFVLEVRQGRGVLRRWEVPAWKELPQTLLPWMATGSNHPKLSPDGRWLAAPVVERLGWTLPPPGPALADDWPEHAYGLWRLDAVAPPKPLAGDGGLMFSADSKLLANGAICWDAATAKHRMFMEQPFRRDAFVGLAPGPGGKTLSVRREGVRLVARELEAELRPGPWTDPATHPPPAAPKGKE